MPLLIQDPFEDDPSYLDEAIFEACEDADSGGAMFAFASSAGANQVLNDEVFSNFAASNSFDLIVGVDAVTNLKALETIGLAAGRLNAMSASVFLHKERGSLFHPKFCWFRNGKRGRIIIGSGNLTIGGLRKNWEAFSIVDIELKDFAAIEARWNNWRELRKAHLFTTDDSRVIERAENNTKWIELLGQDDVDSDGGQSETDDSKTKKEFTGGLECLVAEIPKGGNRWASVGFDKSNYENFFGAKIGTQRRILLRHVESDGRLGDIESRPSVEVKSDNYRFELGSASGLAYPASDPPIAVFLKTSPRNFRYRLVMPSDAQYQILKTLLDQEWEGPENKKRRVQMTAAVLRSKWPDSPLWNIIQ